MVIMLYQLYDICCPRMDGLWEIWMNFFIFFLMYNFQTDFSDWWLRHFLWNCPNMNVIGLHWWSVNPDFCRHMASLGHNELMHNWCNSSALAMELRLFLRPDIQMIYMVHWIRHINSLRPSDAYIRHQTVPSSVQIKACCLVAIKPLSEPMLDYYELDPWKHTSVKFQ